MLLYTCKEPIDKLRPYKVRKDLIMKKADKLFVNDVVEFLNGVYGYAPTKKSVDIMFNCLDYSDTSLRYAMCKINKVVYLFKYYEKNTDEYMTIAAHGEVSRILCENVINAITRDYGYEHACVYIHDIITAIKENTVEVYLHSEMESVFEDLKSRKIYEQFGYASVEELKQDIEDYKQMLQVPKVYIDEIYNADEKVLASDFFKKVVSEYFACPTTEIDEVYTYCPLRHYDVKGFNAYCGVDCAIFTYCGIYYSAFHVNHEIYELHRISKETFSNMRRLMRRDVYPHSTRWVVRTNLAVRRGQSNVSREDILDSCMNVYRKKIHVDRELEY